MRLTLRKTIIGILAGGLVILAVVGLASRGAIHGLIQASALVSHTTDVLYRVQAVLAAASELQRAARGYVIAGDERFLRDYRATSGNLQASLTAVRDLTADNPSQQQRVRQLESLVAQHIREMQRLVDIRRGGGLAAASDLVRTGRGEEGMAAIYQVVDAMATEENALLDLRNRESEARARRSLSIITGGFALAIVLAVGSAYVAGREITRREAIQGELAQRNRDVTEAYIELDSSRKEQIAAKDEILSHVSHELRTPLNAIYQFVSILQDRIAGDINPQQEEYLAIVQRNVTQLQRMIGDVLEATRAQSGKLTFVSEPVDVAETAADLVRLVRSRAGEKDLKISLQADTAALARADPARVRQVLTNLLDNAVKFTPDGGTIVVHVQRDPDRPGFVRASVRDSGPGLDRDASRRVFERLYQAGDHSDSSRKGLGLGLYISRELILAMGGRMWVDTAPGEGATFSFILPVYVADSDRRG